MKLIDAHCHLDEIPGYLPEPDVLPVPCGHSHPSNLQTIKIAAKFKLPFVLGISPQAAQKEDLSNLNANLNEWIAHIRRAKPNAIGEIGLDFHWAKNTEQKEKQYTVFARMLDLAEELRLPVVLHCREAGDEMLTLLEARLPETPNRKPMLGMWHFFSGTESQAQKALGLGLLLSFPPLPSASRRRALLLAPLDRILVETDAPIGARLPSGVAQAVDYVARIKQLDTREVAEQTAKNAARLFNLVPDSVASDPQGP